MKAFYRAEMTFEEIGIKLGCSRARAEQIYQDGMAKLKADPKMLELLKLAKAKEVVEI